MINDYENCPECGAPYDDDAVLRGHSSEVTCRICGHICAVLIYPSDELPIEPPRHVQFVWLTREIPSSDIFLIRNLVAKAREVSISELLEKIRADMSYDAGKYTCFDAERLSEKATKAGLNVRLTRLENWQ